MLQASKNCMTSFRSALTALAIGRGRTSLDQLRVLGPGRGEGRSFRKKIAGRSGGCQRPALGRGHVMSNAFGGVTLRLEGVDRLVPRVVINEYEEIAELAYLRGSKGTGDVKVDAVASL